MISITNDSFEKLSLILLLSLSLTLRLISTTLCGKKELNILKCQEMFFFLYTHTQKKTVRNDCGCTKKGKLFSTSRLPLFNFNLLRIFTFGSCLVEEEEEEMRKFHLSHNFLSLCKAYYTNNNRQRVYNGGGCDKANRSLSELKLKNISKIFQEKKTTQNCGLREYIFASIPCFMA